MKIAFFKEGSKVKKGKKIFILVGMVALLVLTGYLNIRYASNNQGSVPTGNVETVAAASFFTTYKADRASTRAREIEVLEAIIASTSTTPEAKATAEQKRLTLLSQMEKELVLEGLIKAQGFADAVVTTTTENYNVIVKSKDFSSADAAKILDIIISETKTNAANVKIIPID